ncbi:hypothetical protein Tco_1227457 [Tanacetum coccineum]
MMMMTIPTPFNMDIDLMKTLGMDCILIERKCVVMNKMLGIAPSSELRTLMPMIRSEPHGNIVFQQMFGFKGCLAKSAATFFRKAKWLRPVCIVLVAFVTDRCCLAMSNHSVLGKNFCCTGTRIRTAVAVVN